MTRALLVGAAPQPGSRELVGRIAADYDVVIGVDGGGAVCFEAGVTPTLLVGDFDSLDAAHLVEAQRLGVPIRSHPRDKDRTDLDLAIGEARALGVTRIAVTAASTGRLDHTLGVAAALVAASDLRPILVEPDLNGWILSDAGRTEVRLTGPGATVSVVPITQTVRVSASGVRWPLEHADISYTDTVGISNVVLVAEALVSVESGVAWVLSPRTHVPPAEESPPALPGGDDPR